MPIVRKTEAMELVVPPSKTIEPANYMIVWVDITIPKPAPWNPPQRVTRRVLKPLIRRMEEEGFEAFRPILLSHDGFIGDGHRRWTAAQLIGLTRVPVVYTDKSVEELWAGNMGMRAPGAKEWMAVNILGGVTCIPSRTEDQIGGLLTVLGDEGVRFLIERGQSPDIWKTTWKVGQHCKNTDTKFLRKTTYWLVKHKMIDKVKKATYGPEEDRIDPRVLSQAIENDLPLRSSWGFS